MRTVLFALLGLSALAIALPILQTLGDGATFFVVHAAQETDIVLFALCVYILPPVLLFALIILVRLVSKPAARVLASLAVGLLGGLWAISMTSSLPVTAAATVVILVGTLVSLVFFFHRGFRALLRVIGYISPIILLNFIFLSPANKLLAINTSSQEGNTSNATVPIVMLVLDELSMVALLDASERIDEVRLPNFARLARMSTWYFDTLTASANTDKAVPAILSGQHVDKDKRKLATYSEYPLNLFSLLSSSHHIKAIESNTRLCPPDVCKAETGSKKISFNATAMYHDAAFVWLHAVMPTSFTEKYLSSITHSWRDFGFAKESTSVYSLGRVALMNLSGINGDQRANIDQFVTNIRNSQGAELNFLHLSMPHTPWTNLPDGTLYNGMHIPGGDSHSRRWDDNRCLTDQATLRYGMQLEYVDLLLGVILDGLEQSGRLEETLLLVVSDHGLVIAPNMKRRKPVAEALTDVARVPLFIKYPQQAEGKRDMRKAQTVDILPTVLDVLGLPPNHSLHGQSLLSKDWKKPERKVFEARMIPDIEAHMNMNFAIKRFHDVISPGKSTLDSIVDTDIRLDSPVAEAATPDSRLTLVLERPELYLTVDPDSGFVPARLTGTVAGTAVGTEVVIALNSAIAGSGCVYDESGRISVLLDPRQFRSGDNLVEAYIRRNGELHRIATGNDSTSDWQLSRNSDGTVNLVDGEGVLYGQADGLAGKLRLEIRKGSVARLIGWAYDKKWDRAPEIVLLVVEDKIVSSGFRKQDKPPLDVLFREQDKPPPDVILRNAVKDPAVREHWFILDMDYRQLEHAKPSLSVIAVFDGKRLLELRPE